MTMRTKAGAWSPNWATHPGEHLAEYIETKGWSQAEFARIADLSPKLVSTIVTGKNPVTPDTAIKLERVLGVKAQIWLNLQTNWDLFEARAGEERKAASPQTKSWLNLFPVNDLKARGRLPDTKDEGLLMGGLLAFVGIGSPDSFDARLNSLAVHHRQSKAYESSPYHIYSWLKLGEDKARAIELPSYNRDKFLTVVREIRGLTLENSEIFEPQMVALCREAGVALVFEKPISKTCLFGSARWLDDDHAMIQMSLRMKSNDHFWWTFFHEAAHIALHRGRNFLDDQDGQGDGAEAEADQWAEEMLVGRERFAHFKSGLPRSEVEIVEFSKEVGVHPGIVVGMLQHARILPYSNLNKLKARFDWSSEGRSNESALKNYA